MECLAAEFLPQAFSGLRLEHPGASLHATVGGTAEIARQLTADEIDLAITFNAPRDAGLKIVHETRFEMGVVMRPDHPLADQAEVHVDDLFDHPLIIADNSLTIGPVVDD
ncbi:LysR substrate-binding domain-containing protein, partial [Mesorhizobium sp. M4B.F.Ca.ET.089.01.1.1]